jgi:predicted nucleic acid-binding protein
MPARSFFDTNVLVYTDDHDEPDKQARALELVADARRNGTGVVSTDSSRDSLRQEDFAEIARRTLSQARNRSAEQVCSLPR